MLVFYAEEEKNPRDSGPQRPPSRIATRSLGSIGGGGSTARRNRSGPLRAERAGFVGVSPARYSPRHTMVDLGGVLERCIALVEELQIDRYALPRQETESLVGKVQAVPTTTVAAIRDDAFG